MDINGINYHLFENHSSRGSDMLNVEKLPAVQDDCDALFINYASIAWHEMRRVWRSDQSILSQRKPTRRHVACTSYQDFLSSKESFDGLVPLAKMVKLLVEVWKQDL